MGTLFQQPCHFVAGAATLEALPDFAEPEIAFIGRSNVGKSSLINALIGQKALARTSQNPGQTQQLNFFLLGERLMLVDMPGYGFAKVSKAKKGDWDKLIRSYLQGRPNLKRICLLIDSRRGVMPADDEFMDMLDETAVIFQIVMTKADDAKKSELAAALESVKTAISKHVAAYPEPVITSSATREGLESLQDQLAVFANP